jgi:hypothetical protein
MLRVPPSPPTSGFIGPCLPSAAERPPSGPDWVHEIKHDGYRLMARRDLVEVRPLATAPPQLGDLTVAEQQQSKFRIQDDPSVIETYANKFLGSGFDGGAVTLTFGSLRVPLEKADEGPIQGQEAVVQVTHRLTLSPTAALELMNGLNTMMTNLKAQAQRAMQQQPGQQRT